MLKLGRLADYGTLVMTALAADPERLSSAADLATRTHLSSHTVAKLLKQFAKAGLIGSERGANGGYRLARPACDITVADVIAAIDGPIALTQCSVHKGGCVVESHCSVRSNWRLINQTVRNALASVSLAQMAAPLRRSHPEFPLLPAAGISVR
jgi:FeS assembly SUF system regulator